MAFRRPHLLRALQGIPRTTRQTIFQMTPHLESQPFKPTSRIIKSQKPVLLQSFSTINTNNKNKKKRKYVPRKAAIEMTEEARTFFKKLLEMNPDKAGIMLNYKQATSGQPRMVFSFDFVSKEGLEESEEGISLEINDDGTPKSPAETLKDGKQKLYISSNAFLKVLGATVDINMENITPILYDREGNQMDPNA